MKTRQTIEYKLGSDNFNSIVKLEPKSRVLTTQEIFRGILQCAPEISVTFIFPTAAQLIKEWPEIPRAGYSKTFTFRNDGSQPITLTAGEGGSMDGDDSIAVSSYAAHFRLRFGDVTSGMESYQIIRE